MEEGRQRVRSVQAELVATPAGRGRGKGMGWLWKVRGLDAGGGCRLRWRRSWRRERARLPPAESPQMIILEGGTGVWKDPGGGDRRER